MVKSLIQECVRMSSFDHPNILAVTGVCLDGGSLPYVVMPFMFNGDLLSYLKKERDYLVTPLDAEEDEKTVRELVLSAASSLCFKLCHKNYIADNDKS